jgi:chromosome segregation ATPase
MADDAVLKAIAEMSTELTSIRTDVTSLRTEVTSVRTELSSTRAELSSTRTEIMGRMDGLERAVATQLADLGAELVSTRTGIMGRVDRLQNGVEAVRDDVAVNFGRADHAASIGKGVREEVRAIATQVSAMERQILRLRTEMDELRRGNP